ncbi:HdeD family acid-resistance protein [Bordetella petrii]|uniref:HdeD family acid-resistance protein n=1 Tax=Bordetella petrii TaxID=94624 RepID=UPI001E47E31D|nr:tripartite tricarboxylate transporter TctB family protein [Bordetella petrii]MCD0503601.1 tripartite tricarboxylate transporter TctB family protein [Bordetella petrii]
MIQIALLLFGADFVRRQAGVLAWLGAGWALLGLFIIVDGMDGVRFFPVHLFGAFLLLESLVTLSVAPGGAGAQKALLYFKGGLFLFIAALILSGRETSNLLMAIVFGLAYFVVGTLQMASSWVVRFPHWKQAFLGGVAQVAFALFLFQPYPTHYHGTLSAFVGLTLLVGGVNTWRVARRARQLRDGRSVFDLLAPGDLIPHGHRKPVAGTEPDAAQDIDPTQSPLVVHVWTPEGSSKNAPVPRPLINRYIAAVDIKGVISTGHAALEMPPATYISLYPAVDIDRSPSEFFRLLKATHDNDVPGEFQPDYPTESAAWCPSTRQILFHQFNRAGLDRFWAAYRQKEIYNLTYRNCSSTVSFALEAALDGALQQESASWKRVLRTLLMPELWIAAQVRKRATTMAWTPGLVLDYARALRAIVHPAQGSWLRSLRWAARQSRASASDLVD